MKLSILLFLLALISPLYANQLPLEQFTRHGDYLNMKLSPDGKHLLARARLDGRVVLLFIDTKTMKVVNGIRPPNKDQIHSAEWVSKDRVVYQISEKYVNNDRPVPTGELFAINVDGSKSTILFGYRASDEQAGSRISSRENSRASAEILSYLPNDPKHILIAEYPWLKKGNTYYLSRERFPNIIKLNINNGRQKKVENIPFANAKIFTTQDGDIRFVRYTDKNFEIKTTYRQNESDDWRPYQIQGIDNFIPFALSNDGTKLFGTGIKGEKGLNTLYQVELNSNEISDLFSDIKADIYSYSMDPELNMPVIALSYPDKFQYSYADVKSQMISRHKALFDAFGGQELSITSQSEDGKLVLVRVTSDVNPGEYYLFNAETKDARFLWANRSWINPSHLAAKTPISFEASDGLSINGFITMPKSVDEKQKSPLVVMLHGGPHGAFDKWEFDTEVQLLANRGYAVLQVNFRGSGGFGDTFERAGYREWGGKMIQDIIEATQFSVEKFPINGDRICTYGASYGGYAALMATVRAPDLYKCTVGYVGLYNLEYAYTNSDITDNLGGLAYLKKVIGTDKEVLAANSPVNYADIIKAKVMLIHGAKDARVSIDNSTLMKHRLEEAGKKVEYLDFSIAGHGVYDESGRRELYSNLLKFLDENIGH